MLLALLKTKEKEGQEMKKYLVKRLIQLPIILLGVIAVTFLIVQFTPGDPAVKLAGGNARPEDIEAIREQLGLNKPVLEQFVDYFVNIFHGDFGRSFVRKKTEIGGELVTAPGQYGVSYRICPYLVGDSGYSCWES